METNKILENLCYYDSRNPDCTLDEDKIAERKKRKPNCSCDNCFYGRTEMAEYILNISKKDFTESEVKWLIYYGESSNKEDAFKIDDLDRIDVAIELAFDMLKTESVFNAEYIESIFWQRIKFLTNKNK